MENREHSAQARRRTILLTAAALALAVNTAFGYVIASAPTQGQRYFAAVLEAPADTGADAVAAAHPACLKS
ncbi:MAG: hypothetical protein ISP90_17570 [Nevskia sp.]|nr:hypothetical protein [Nevskia sp.]